MIQTLHSHEVANDSIVTTAETVLCTLPGVNTPRRVSVRLKGWAQVTTGAATTALTARIRRGTDATGTLIGEVNAEQIEAAAGSTEEVEIEANDEGVDLAGATYVLTVQQTAATGNGTGLQASLEASFPV
jgi:hypothetical protein